MSAAKQGEPDRVRVKTDKLCREETYTDTETVSFRQLIPIRLDGSRDESRSPTFMGQTYVMSEAGPVPVQAELRARTLEEAVVEFPEAARKALEELIRKSQELKRQQGAGAPSGA